MIEKLIIFLSLVTGKKIEDKPRQIGTLPPEGFEYNRRGKFKRGIK